MDNKTNPKIQSVVFPDLPIRQIEFSADGRQIIAVGRRKYFYVYHVELGQIQKINYIIGKDNTSILYVLT